MPGQPDRDDDRRGRPRARRAAGLLRRRRAARTSRSTSPSGPSRRTSSWSTSRASSARGRRACRCRIGDPTIVTGATAVTSMLELFGYYLQGGLIDVGFLGAAQIDRFGNINTTVIGEYANRRRGCPGCGGACEIAINARQVFVIMRQSAALVRRADRLPDVPRQPRRRGAVGAHPARAGLARARAVGRRHRPRHLSLRRHGEMRLDSLHPGATIEEVRASMGWAPSVAADAGDDTCPDRRRAAPHPRGARPRGRLHVLTGRAAPDPARAMAGG